MKKSRKTSSQKTALVIRPGALGDMCIVSPVFKALKRDGYHITLQTGPRGHHVLKHNPYIDEWIMYEYEGKDNPDVEKQWEDLRKKLKPDYFKNFAESIEVNVSLHPRSPAYNFPKQERYERGNRNFYEVTEEWAEIKLDQYYPDLYLQPEEEEAVGKYLNKSKLNVLWALSGSGGNKVYPYTEQIMVDLLKKYDDIHFMTVGNAKCKILEGDTPIEGITNLSDKISFRDTIALCKLSDLVVSPDTGTLHAAGAFDTPKIGILGHTTIENVTKHFENDYSLEADEALSECSPCFRLIYSHFLQCPIDEATGGAFCMSKGQSAERLQKQIEKVLDETRNARQRSNSLQEEVSGMPTS